MEQTKFSKKELALLKTLKISDTGETITNPYSGKSVYLEPEAVALYDLAKGAEMIHNTTILDKALTIFRTHWPNEYMTLLD